MLKKIVFIIILFLFILVPQTAFTVQKGQVEYISPIDYTVFNESALNSEAEILYEKYLSTNDPVQKQVLLKELLAKYSTLTLINKEKALYFTRLGIVFDKLGNDRRAKSNFFRATNMSQSDPYAYYSFGNYFYARLNYKLALRAYQAAYNNGYDKNYDNLYKMGAIYEKYGDYTLAIKYYKMALSCNKNEILENKILILEDLLKQNSLYNEKRGKKK